MGVLLGLAAACRVSAQVDQLRVLVPLYARPDGEWVSVAPLLLAVPERRRCGSQYLNFVVEGWFP